MGHAVCPHCGEDFLVLDWGELGRCPACGRSLGQRHDWRDKMLERFAREKLVSTKRADSIRSRLHTGQGRD
jgi:hypothetical protein